MAQHHIDIPGATRSAEPASDLRVVPACTRGRPGDFHMHFIGRAAEAVVALSEAMRGQLERRLRESARRASAAALPSGTARVTLEGWRVGFRYLPLEALLEVTALEPAVKAKRP